jgi:hypothetical protein
MKPIRSRLDGWLTDSPVSGEDLSLFRILYALFVLLTLWRSDYAASLPPGVFDPPGGPFALLSSAPSGQVIWVLQASLCFALSALAIGWRTGLASVTAALLQILLYGIGYSFGKIDHTIFLPLVPLLFSFSAWGSNFSVDAHRAGQKEAVHSWVPRCLAIALGLGMMTAGLAKVRGGWLSWETQAAFSRLVNRQNVFNAPMGQLEFLKSIDHPVIWEILDYATVMLECGIIIAALLSWRTFYLAIASLTVFHFFVWPTMGILFPYNLPAYAAFVPWSRLGGVIPIRALDRLATGLATHAGWRWITCAILACLGLLLAWVRPDWLVPTVYVIVLVTAAIVGIGYLAGIVWRIRAVVAKKLV